MEGVHEVPSKGRAYFAQARRRVLGSDRTVYWVAQEEIPARDQKKKKKNQRLIDQLDPASRHIAAETDKASELASHRKMVKNLGLKVPQGARVPIEQCLWNVTPKHACINLHTDRGLDTVTFQVEGRKIWILYEPDPPVTTTNKVLQRQSKFFQRWAQHFKEPSRTLEDTAMGPKVGGVTQRVSTTVSKIPESPLIALFYNREKNLRTFVRDESIPILRSCFPYMEMAREYLFKLTRELSRNRCTELATALVT
jgi:hypothetical protein